MLWWQDRERERERERERPLGGGGLASALCALAHPAALGGGGGGAGGAGGGATPGVRGSVSRMNMMTGVGMTGLSAAATGSVESRRQVRLHASFFSPPPPCLTPQLLSPVAL